MGLKANICQVCGGALKNCGTYYKCVCCDTEYRIDEAMSKEEMDAYFRKLNAFEDAERNLSVAPPRFDEAESEFGLIVQKYPDWSAGYWGLVRAKFGIKFEQDSGGKAVPSCYKSTYEDFRNTDEYKKAVVLAETPELRQSYEKMAEYIARVTKEWREEAQKYDYDVFISFKASNDSDGSETRDAREMHKLYDLLKDKGYRVFFSPVTLITDGVVGKGSEPYIFNALDKAKALIVYGSRKEYFTSTWVQNEWQRYLRAMKAGKKEKDSLLVLYEGFNPKELPQGLRRIQGIEYGVSAFPAILSFLERVFNEQREKRENVLVSQIEALKQEVLWFKTAMGSNSKLFHQATKVYKEKKFDQAFQLFNRLANENYSKAFYWLGKCYFCGYGVEQDLNLAFDWYTKAAEHGDINAQFRLANCYWQGWGIDTDKKLAVHWYRKAADKGSSKARKLYTNRDFFQTLDEIGEARTPWLKIFADSGNADIQNELGDCYYYGIEIQKDETQAVKWYSKAAEQGNEDAAISMWVCTYCGIGTAKSEKEALHWKQQIEDNKISFYRFGYEENQVFDKIELAAAAKWYKKKAVEGDITSLKKLADCYENGNGVKRDQNKALKLYIKAAEQGNAKAQLFLGEHYYNGWGSCYEDERDYDEALKWYKKAAEQGEAEAQLWMGDYYSAEAEEEFEGDGEYYIDINEAKQNLAIEWYTRAAEQGQCEAQCRLAEYYFDQKNFKESVKWYTKAAKQGDAEAQYVTACFISGKFPYKLQNNLNAIGLYLKSAIQGNANAQFTLGEYDYSNNKAEAFKWYCKAEYHGNLEKDKESKLYLRLGDFYFYGFCTEKNYAEAKKYYQKILTTEEFYANKMIKLCDEKLDN